MASSVTYLVKVLGAKCQLGEGHEQHQTETVEQHGGQKALEGLWMQQAEKIRHPRQDKCDSSRGKQATRGGLGTSGRSGRCVGEVSTTGLNNVLTYS